MEYLKLFLDYVLHLDHYLLSFVATHGLWTYLLAFAVIFCETGLVIVPFLPGDSLLFTLGSIAAQPLNPLSLMLLCLILTAASILGNQLNYAIGRYIGPRVFSHKQNRFLNKKYLEEAHQFYEKHGGKTIILARFMPIVRTFVPFVAGVGAMSKHLFRLYNVCSAILWIGSLLCAGYFLGSLSWVKDNFIWVIYGIILISLLPPCIAFLRTKMMRTSA